jgi:hypothetical protein
MSPPPIPLLWGISVHLIFPLLQREGEGGDGVDYDQTDHPPPLNHVRFRALSCILRGAGPASPLPCTILGSGLEEGGARGVLLLGREGMKLILMPLGREGKGGR